MERFDCNLQTSAFIIAQVITSEGNLNLCRLCAMYEVQTACVIGRTSLNEFILNKPKS